MLKIIVLNCAIKPPNYVTFEQRKLPNTDEVSWKKSISLVKTKHLNCKRIQKMISLTGTSSRKLNKGTIFVDFNVCKIRNTHPWSKNCLSIQFANCRRWFFLKLSSK